METVNEQTNRQIIESFFDGESYRSPEHEYQYRTENFEARIPQTGEIFDRDSLREMQKAMGRPPAARLERITGEGDIWVVEGVNTYDGGAEFYVCNIMEFSEGKVKRETRYYGPPMTPDRP